MMQELDGTPTVGEVEKSSMVLLAFTHGWDDSTLFDADRALLVLERAASAEREHGGKEVRDYLEIVVEQMEESPYFTTVKDVETPQPSASARAEKGRLMERVRAAAR